MQMKVRDCLTGFFSILKDNLVLSVHFSEFLADLVSSCEELKSFFLDKIFKFRDYSSSTYENVAWQKGFEIDHSEHIFSDKKNLR